MCWFMHVCAYVLTRALFVCMRVYCLSVRAHVFNFVKMCVSKCMYIVNVRTKKHVHSSSQFITLQYTATTHCNNTLQQHTATTHRNTHLVPKSMCISCAYLNKWAFWQNYRHARTQSETHTPKAYLNTCACVHIYVYVGMYMFIELYGHMYVFVWMCK